MCPVPNGFRDLFDCTVYCTDEQHAMSSHELKSALMLTVEFLKMYYTRQTVPTFLLEQYILVLKIVRNIFFLLIILKLYSKRALSRKWFGIGHMYTIFFFFA
jgi:hypothetical protein